MNRGSMRSGHTTGTMPCMKYILYNIALIMHSYVQSKEYRIPKKCAAIEASRSYE